jgi:hypothetical protein
MSATGSAVAAVVQGVLTPSSVRSPVQVVVLNTAAAMSYSSRCRTRLIARTEQICSARTMSP